MKSFVKSAALAMAAASFAFVASAYAADDNVDLSTAGALCKAEVTAATGTPADKIRSGPFSIKARSVAVRMIVWVDGKSKSVGCTLDRKTQKLSDIKWPEGISAPAAAPAPAPAAVAAPEATAPTAAAPEATAPAATK